VAQWAGRTPAVRDDALARGRDNLGISLFFFPYHLRRCVSSTGAGSAVGAAVAALRSAAAAPPASAVRNRLNPAHKPVARGDAALF